MSTFLNVDEDGERREWPSPILQLAPRPIQIQGPSSSWFARPHRPSPLNPNRPHRSGAATRQPAAARWPTAPAAAAGRRTGVSRWWLTTAGAAQPAATADPPGPRASPTVPISEPRPMKLIRSASTCMGSSSFVARGIARRFYYSVESPVGSSISTRHAEDVWPRITMITCEFPFRYCCQGMKG